MNQQDCPHRDFTRVPVKIWAEISGADKTIPLCETRNVSVKGLYLVTAERLPLDTRCRVKLFLGEPSSPLRIVSDGRIAHVDDTGMGVELTGMDVDSFNHICRLVLYNSVDSERIEQELNQHLGLKRRS